MQDVPASHREYSISELEEVSGIPRRTIHYYIARDLLPPADGSGLGARYREVHVLRLKVIEVLKKLGLKLEGIRELLDSMSLEALRETFTEAEEHPSKVAYLLQRRMAHDTLVKLVEELGDVTLVAAEEGPGPMMAQLVDYPPGTRSLRSSPPPSSVFSQLEVGESAGQQSVQPSLDDATTWRRMQVTPDLEIHYRPGRDSRFTGKLRAVVRMIRAMFAGEGPAPPDAGKKE